MAATSCAGAAAGEVAGAGAALVDGAARAIAACSLAGSTGLAALSTSLGAAASGGPMINFAGPRGGTDGAAGAGRIAPGSGTAGLMAAICGSEPGFVGAGSDLAGSDLTGSDLAASVRGFSGPIAGAAVTGTGATVGGSAWLCTGPDWGGGGLSDAVTDGGMVDAGGGFGGSAIAFFLIAPVTESSPCSITVTRENSRSR